MAVSLDLVSEGCRTGFRRRCAGEGAVEVPRAYNTIATSGIPLQECGVRTGVALTRERAEFITAGFAEDQLAQLDGEGSQDGIVRIDCQTINA